MASTRGQHHQYIQIKNPLEAPKGLNEVWSMDFMAEVLWRPKGQDVQRHGRLQPRGAGYGRRPELSGQKVVETLGHLDEEIGLPKTLRCDNGPEFISRTLGQWCKKKNVELMFIQPGCRTVSWKGSTGSTGRTCWTPSGSTTCTS